MSTKSGSPWIIMSGFIIIIAGAIFHIGITLLETSGRTLKGYDFLPYLLYIGGLIVAILGVFYTPPRERLLKE